MVLSMHNLQRLVPCHHFN